jgi:ABC-type uncharacterized transport system ATPase subunit
VVTFEAVGEELLWHLRAAASPVRMEVKQRSVQMTLRSTESQVLALLGSIAARWPILHFEVSGPSLEDIFMEILGNDQKQSLQARDVKTDSSSPLGQLGTRSE